MANTRYSTEIASIQNPNESVTRFIRITDHFTDVCYVSRRTTLRLSEAHKMLKATERALDSGKHPENNPLWVCEGAASNPAIPVRAELADEVPGVNGESDLGLQKHWVPRNG